MGMAIYLYGDKKTLEQIENDNDRKLFCDWGSGFGLPLSIQEILLGIHYYCLQKCSAMSYSKKQKDILRQHWLQLKRRVNDAACPGGHQTAITKMKAKKSKHWHMSLLEKDTTDEKAVFVLAEPIKNFDLYIELIEWTNTWFEYLQWYRHDGGYDAYSVVKRGEAMHRLKDSFTEDVVDSIPLKYRRLVPHLDAMGSLCRWMNKDLRSDRCLNNHETVQFQNLLTFYGSYIKETLCHWNTTEFYALVQTAVDHDLGLTYG